MFTKLNSFTKREHVNFQESSDIYITFHFLLMILVEFKSLLVKIYKLKHQKRNNGQRNVLCVIIYNIHSGI